MEEPIRRFQRIILDDDDEEPEEPMDLKERIRSSLLCDDKDEFLKLIKSPGFEEVRSWFQPLTVFEFDGVNCSSALLSGATEGLIDLKDDLFEIGMSPLHLAVLAGAPKVTKFLLEKGYSVNDKCDYAELKLKQATPLDLGIETIESNGLYSMWTPLKSIFELLVMLCDVRRRASIETVRLLVQSTQEKEHVKQAFLKYAEEGKLVQSGVLLIAAPDVLMPSCLDLRNGWTSSIKLYKILNSMVTRTEIQEGLVLLLDAFAMIGAKLVTYVRLELPHFSKFDGEDTILDIAWLLREAVKDNKREDLANDYLLRFFKPVLSEAEQMDSSDWMEFEEFGFRHVANTRILTFGLLRRDINLEYIDSVLPIRQPEDADRLRRAIEEKHSSSTALCRLPECIGTSNKEEFMPMRKKLRVEDAFSAYGASCLSKSGLKPVAGDKF